MTSLTSTPVRLGVVGCARILPAHLRGIVRLQEKGLDPVRITALCARRREDALMFNQRGEGPPPRPAASDNPADPLGAPHRYVSDMQTEPAAVFTDWRDMLGADCVDAVLVLAPVGLHHEIALAALAAGKHVLIEKPLAISVRTGRAVAESAARHGLVAGVAENVRYSERTRALRWALDENLIGEAQVWLSGGVGGEWAPDAIVANTAWRHRKLTGGGGPALDHGVHLMHQMRYLMGPVEAVSALTKTMEPLRRERGTDQTVRNELEDLYLAQFRFSSGAIGTAFSGWGGRGERSGLDASPIIYGSGGCIKGEAIFDDERALGAAGDLLATQAPALRAELFPYGLTDGFGLELLDFLGAIATGGQMEASAAEGVVDLAMAYAILESSLARGPVRVDDVGRGTVAGYQAEIDEHYNS
jgi:predicted dehydrogenase